MRWSNLTYVGREFTRVLLVCAGVAIASGDAVPVTATVPAPRNYFEVGRDLLAGGDSTVGLPLVAAAAVAGPDAKAAQVYLLGLLNQSCFEWDLAGLEAARPVLPKEPAILECLGRRFEGSGRFAEAETAFLDWADTDSGLAEPYARLGELYVTAGQPAKALGAFARYREHNPGSQYALRRMADIAAAQVDGFRPRHAHTPEVARSAPGGSKAGPGPEAQFGLAVRYQHGLGVPVDATLAARAYQRAAEAGHPPAQLHLALMLQDGRGVERDPEEAVRWLSKAAETGFAEAQLYLALACLTGNGMPRDFVQAFAWSHRAADQGLPEAEFLLGTLYAHGIGIAPDPEAASGWFLKAGATLLETGRWRAGRQAIVASIATDQSDRTGESARLTAADDGPDGKRGATP